MRKRIPVIPVPLDRAARMSRKFMGLSDHMTKFFPSMHFSLEQAEFDFEPREWIALAIFGFVFYFFTLFPALFIITLAAKIEILRAFSVTFLIGFSVGFMAFVYILLYPKVFVGRKVKDIEKNLPAAPHHLLIEVRSGVPLSNSLVSIAGGDYGLLSYVIGQAVKDIETGKPESAALEKIARQTPSLYLRRVVWQLVNSIKSGADIGKTIKQIVDGLAIDQSIDIKNYGSQLNPLALMYMIFAVIFPTLGITFLLVLTSFIGLGIDVSFILAGILGFLVVFQIMLIGLIKSKRPVGI